MQQNLQGQLEEEEYGQAQLRECKTIMHSFEIIYAKTNSTCKSTNQNTLKASFTSTSDKDHQHHEGGERAGRQ